MFNKKECGARITEAREKNGLSRADLAKKLCITDKYLYQIERGEKGLSTERLVLLCEILGVSADRILFGAEPSEEYSAITGLLHRCDPKKLPHLESIVKSFINAYYE